MKFKSNKIIDLQIELISGQMHVSLCYDQYDKNIEKKIMTKLEQVKMFDL